MFIIGSDHEMVSQLWDISDMTNYRKTSLLTCGNMLLKLFKETTMTIIATSLSKWPFYHLQLF